MSSDGLAISARNLTKTYRLFSHPGDRVRQFLSLGLRRYHREFTALRDISFDIRRGETVGVMGRNGSGKSTLLQLICGILKPTAGAVTVHGRIAALLELGAGFNPEFTGRENVRFQGGLMGLGRAQVEACFDAIVDFADIGDFIDQPVRTYSSGMFMRLAFAVAVHAEPDILVIDEALSVGDQAFQSRCLGKIQDLQRAGTTILVVSHALNLIATLCTRALLLDQGRAVCLGPVPQVIARYETIGLELEARRHAPAMPANAAGGPARPMEILAVDMDQAWDAAAGPARHQPVIRIRVTFTTRRTIQAPCHGLSIRSADGVVIWTITSDQLPGRLEPVRGGDTAVAQWTCRLPLGSGAYLLAVGVGETIHGEYVRHDRWHEAGRISVAPREGMLGGGLLEVTRARIEQGAVDA